MQETWVQTLIWEDPAYHRATKFVHHNYWVCALEPGNSNCWCPCTPKLLFCNKRSHCNEKPAHSNWRVVPAQCNSRKAHIATKTQMVSISHLVKIPSSSFSLHLGWSVNFLACPAMPWRTCLLPVSLVSVPCVWHSDHTVLQFLRWRKFPSSSESILCLESHHPSPPPPLPLVWSDLSHPLGLQFRVTS